LQSAERFPAFYPLVDRAGECSGVAQRLFDCVTPASKQLPEERDPAAAAKGLLLCQDQLLAYCACIESQDSKKLVNKLTRVPEAYRRDGL